MSGSVFLRRAHAAGHTPPAGQAGFLLPLALNVALVLTLSSLLLLTLALQSRLQAAVQRHRRQAEDHLMNAAQHWAGRVHRLCPEALAAPQRTWDGQAWSGEAACGTLKSGPGYRMVSYSPEVSRDQGTGELVLELVGGEARHNGIRGAFALHWRRLPAAVPQLLGIEERGLRAAAGAAAADGPGGEAP